MVEVMEPKKVVEETRKKMAKAVEATKKDFQNIRLR